MRADRPSRRARFHPRTMLSSLANASEASDEAAERLARASARILISRGLSCDRRVYHTPVGVCQEEWDDPSMNGFSTAASRQLVG